MNMLKSIALAAVIACPVAAMAQTSTSSGATPTTDQSTRDRDATSAPASRDTKHSAKHGDKASTGNMNRTAGDAGSQADRDRPQGGSTAGANGRQDPTVKLNNGTSDSTEGSATSRQGSVGANSQNGGRNQGGTSAGANGRQDPTIKTDSSTQQPQAPK